MGTHPSGPSFVVEAAAGREEQKGTTLKNWIEENPSVLSVAKALSIQAHPDKVLARKLHEEQPSAYKDGNHKPEMALALTEFQALCGFVTLEELKNVLKDVPEIAVVVGDEAIADVLGIEEHDESVKSVVQSVFTKLMSASKEIISDLVLRLKTRLNTEKQVRMLTEKEQLVLVLEEQYPADVGVLSSFFLNYVKLSPAHAYLSGECVECMATSDNVVRAGLTPKYRDVQTLCSMLTYKQILSGDDQIRLDRRDFRRFCGDPLSAHVSRYTPPFEEFEVDRCSLPSGEAAVLPASPGPSLVVVVAGEGRMEAAAVSGSQEDYEAAEGYVFFVPAGIELRLTAGSAGELLLYRAGVNSKLLQ
ncbi:unnamed protein product [Spirodela intermedia]|uniref:Mannose-6-phosphate isomerase n=1 Tax=Spirodela intermedia TaxID=51605 RepID=A0A7I8JMF2_SPIIN|nr:unnamed protein product [Spirodela intermedia]CAA6671314.1 unnamed protein product [Spirodela intermedia]